MKKIKNIYAVLLMVAAVVFFGSCQDDTNLAKEETQEYVPTEFFDFNVDLEEIEANKMLNLSTGIEERQMDVRRMDMINRNQNGIDTGVDFVFRNGENINVHLFFKQGAKVVAKTVKMAVSTNGVGKKVLRHANIGVPQGISLSQGGVTVTGAIGMTNPRVQNGSMALDVVGIKKFLSGNDTYVIPMYFPAKAIEKQGTDYILMSQFKMYGSIIGLPVENPNIDNFKLREIEIESAFFETQGIVNVAPENPTWTTTTQNDRTVKIVDVITKAENGYNTLAGKNKLTWYFIWVKPKNGKITSTSTVKFGLKSFTSKVPTTIAAGAADLKITVPIKNNLKENLVHRIPKMTFPEIGDLIITEVLRGDLPKAVMFEIYNCSDHDVNLWNYQMKSTDPATGQTYISALLQDNQRDDRCVVVRDRNEGINGDGKILGGSSVPLDPRYFRERVILKPGQIAIFFEQSVRHDKGITNYYNNAHYMFNFGTNNYRGFHLWKKGGSVELQKKGATPEAGKTIDAIFRFKQPVQNDIWFYTMMRKPDRNAPRKYMQVGEHTDWVIRYHSENIDWGGRFSFYQTGSTNATIDWVQKRVQPAFPNGYAQARPMYELKTVLNGHSYYYVDNTNPHYVDIPSWWTQLKARD